MCFAYGTCDQHPPIRALVSGLKTPLVNATIPGAANNIDSGRVHTRNLASLG
jgi:hypothetical protein